MRSTTFGSEAVVVPAVAAPSSTTIVRSLGRRGVHTIAVSETPDSPAFSSRYCDESYLVPDPTTDLLGYKDALLSLAKRPEVRTVVPVREPDIHVLAKYRDEFAAHVATPWPSFEAVRVLHDRTLLYDAAAAADVPFPETQPLDEVDDWDRRRIVKGRYALLASDYVPSMSERECASPPKTIFLDPGVEPDVEAVGEAMGHTPLAQAYLGGEEYTFRGVYDRGEPVVTTAKRLLRGMKYSRGPSVYHETVDEPELEARALALMAELEWHGVTSCGFIRDPETEEFNLIEVNPRFWANVSLDLHAGVDSPYCYWRLAAGDADGFTAAPRPGVASHLLRGEVSYLHSVLREEYPLVEKPAFARAVGDVLRSLIEQPNFDYLTFDDPEPFLRDLRNAIAEFRRSARGRESGPAPAASDRGAAVTGSRP